MRRPSFMLMSDQLPELESDKELEGICKQLVQLIEKEPKTDPDHFLQEAEQCLEQIQNDRYQELYQYLIHEKTLNQLLNKQLSSENSLQICFLFKTLYTQRESSKQFVQNFIPILLWSFLMRKASDRPLLGTGSLLLHIYRVEKGLFEQDGESMGYTADISIPDLLEDSVYHHSIEVTSPGACLFVHQDFNVEKVPSDPFPDITNLSQSDQLMEKSLCLFVSSINSRSPWAQRDFCRLVARVCSSGSFLASTKSFPVSEQDEENVWDFIPRKSVKRRRLDLSIKVLQHFVDGLRLLLGVRNCSKYAEEALKILHARATEDLLPEILLPTVCLLEEIQ